MPSLLAQPAVKVFAFWYLILVIKMVVVIFATTAARLRTGALVAPEDYDLQKLDRPRTPAHNEAVERPRRALQNDLENILPFFGTGLIYALTDPSLLLARIYFAGFAIARILHTFAYLRGLQPHRTIAFSVAGIFHLLIIISALINLL